MKITIIGCGTMGEAILKGWLNHAVAAKDLLVVQRSIERTKYLRDTYPVEVVGDISAASQSDIVMVGVKPQGIKEVLNELGPVLKPGALVISIAVGVTTKFIESQLGGKNPVVRAMPNTPSLVMRGTIGLAASEKCSAEELATAKNLLSTVGSCVVVDENLIDVVAATSGSGPAYFYWLVETLTNAAIELGLESDVARLLTRETFIGAALLMDQSNEEAATLRARVTSPKGTTQAAIESLEKNEVSKEFLKALQAAIARAKELNEG